MNRRARILIGLIALLMVCVVSTASAVIDPRPNRMSIYFDVYADVYEWETVPYVVVLAFVVLTNPDFPELYGYEMGVDVEGNYINTGQVLHGQGPITVGCFIIGSGCHVGLAAPMVTSEATLLVTLQLFVMDMAPIRFTLHDATPPSTGIPGAPAVLLENDVIMPIYPSFWDEVTGEPGECAVLNGNVVSVDATSWDAVKSIYR